MSMGFWAMSTHEPLIFKASESPQENEYVSKEGFGDRNTQSSTSSSDPGAAEGPRSHQQHSESWSWHEKGGGKENPL